MTELAIHIPSRATIDALDYLDAKFPELDLGSEGEQFSYCPELWVKRLFSNIKDLGSITRVYFGNEFCQRLIPSLEELKEARKIISEKKLAFTLVTPYVTDSGLEKIEPLLVYLSGLKETGMEVVINDPGVLDMVLEYKNLIPVMGRLKDPMKRMARFVHQLPQLSPSQKDALSSTNISIEAYQKYLLDLGVERVEYDLVPQGISINFNTLPFRASFYYPWTYITTGRICEMGSLHQKDEDKFTLYNPCGKECQKYYASWLTEWPGSSNKIFAFGNTIFMLCEAPPDVLKRYITQGFDRIIYQPVIPM
ncbi:MAG: hypothetical protein BWY26_00887 [Elusimicrobia bacterium ADurb.Bin231]|nr:MAG: hypothetical protein BWY26_00887 [Elusimicrobia bacterium ADurb.Bin231]